MLFEEMSDDILIIVLSKLDFNSLRTTAHSSPRVHKLLLENTSIWVQALALCDATTYHYLLTQRNPNIGMIEEGSFTLKPLLTLARQHQDLLQNKRRRLALTADLQLPAREIELPHGRIFSLAALPHDRIALGIFNGPIVIWDGATNAIERVLASNHIDAFPVNRFKLIFNTYTQGLISCDNNGVITLWNWNRENDDVFERRINTQSCLMSSIAMSATRLVSISNFTTLHIWDALTGDCVRTIETIAPFWREHDEWVTFTSLVKIDDQHVALGYQTGAIAIYNITTGTSAFTLDARGNQPYNEYNRNQLISLPNNQLISIFSGCIKIWDLNTRICENQCYIPYFSEPENIVDCILVSIDRVATSAKNGEIKIWDIRIGECLRTIKIADRNDSTTHRLTLSTEDDALYVNVNNKVQRFDFVCVNLTPDADHTHTPGLRT